MKGTFLLALPRVLKHEGGFVDHPSDPGGATNKGVTIGTLKRLGIDVDSDGDVDVVDLMALRLEHLELIYRIFYWDAVRADLLPSGLDYAVFDFAVNSGPARAAEHLQRIVGVTADGDIGPMTLAAVARHDAATLVEALCNSRLRFLKGRKIWATFGKGWTRRVEEVRAQAMVWAR
jgi:lysozyme family protein